MTRDIADRLLDVETSSETPPDLRRLASEARQRIIAAARPDVGGYRFRNEFRACPPTREDRIRTARQAGVDLLRLWGCS